MPDLDAQTEQTLRHYVKSTYADEVAALEQRLPLAEEAHLDAWRSYAREAADRGVAAVLTEKLVQLQFPVRSGISEEPAYRAATRQGGPVPTAGEPLRLERPEGLELWIRPTVAGAVPVLVSGCREDFVTLVQALTGRNEPVPVPPWMGACLVKGLVNWDRVERYRRAWEERSGTTGGGEAAWQEELARLRQRKEQYQDTLILLSRGSYSDVPAAETGRDEAQWLADSLLLRSEHECFHYFTWRLFGRIRSHLLDELLADMVALVAVYGTYRKETALRCLGIAGSASDELLPAARLLHYRGDPALPDEAIPELVPLAARAAAGLEAVMRQQVGDLAATGGRRAVLLLALLALGLDGLIAADAAERLQRTRRELAPRLLESRDDGVWSCHVPATPAGTAVCLTELEERTAELGLPAKSRGRLGLVLDEILSNVAKYAYGGGVVGDAHVTLRPAPRGTVELEIVDSGRPFNPLYAPLPDVLAPPTLRPDGGLGIYLVRRLAADLGYARQDGQNRLTARIPAGR